MDPRILFASATRVASAPVKNFGMASAIMIAIIIITTSSSIKVKAFLYVVINDLKIFQTLIMSFLHKDEFPRLVRKHLSLLFFQNK